MSSFCTVSGYARPVGGRAGADAARSHLPRSRSRSRRSRLVGRPAPRSRTGTTDGASRGGGGGVRSSTAVAATVAETRFTIVWRTTRIRSNPPMRTRTSSPGRTGCAAFARSPFTRTWPARQAVVAADRVLNWRTAHSHASMRTGLSRDMLPAYGCVRDAGLMSGTSGDSWVEGPDGERYWGRFGAAGLLVVSPAFEVLLQHRAAWSHFGGTWGMPG